MTPEKARKLLQDATPGPWETSFGVAGVPEGWDEHYASLIMGHTRLNLVEYQPLEEEDYANFELAAAAPELAEIVAGMRWEYSLTVSIDMGDGSIDYEGYGSYVWYNNLAGAQNFVAQEELPEGHQLHIIRRLVSDPEVVE